MKNKLFKLSSVLEVLGANGYWKDNLKVDRLLIERNRCPKCDAYLVYVGFSNPTEYRAYAVCEKCDLAKRFWTETARSASFKKQVLPSRIHRTDKRKRADAPTSAQLNLNT